MTFVNDPLGRLHEDVEGTTANLIRQIHIKPKQAAVRVEGREGRIAGVGGHREHLLRLDALPRQVGRQLRGLRMKRAQEGDVSLELTQHLLEEVVAAAGERVAAGRRSPLIL